MASGVLQWAVDYRPQSEITMACCRLASLAEPGHPTGSGEGWCCRLSGALIPTTLRVTYSGPEVAQHEAAAGAAVRDGPYPPSPTESDTRGESNCCRQEWIARLPVGLDPLFGLLVHYWLAESHMSTVTAALRHARGLCFRPVGEILPDDAGVTLRLRVVVRPDRCAEARSVVQSLNSLASVNMGAWSRTATRAINHSTAELRASPPRALTVAHRFNLLCSGWSLPLESVLEGAFDQLRSWVDIEASGLADTRLTWRANHQHYPSRLGGHRGSTG